MWEGWKAGFLAFHPFHTLSFPWPALECVFKKRSYRKPRFSVTSFFFPAWPCSPERSISRPRVCLSSHLTEVTGLSGPSWVKFPSSISFYNGYSY